MSTYSRARADQLTEAILDAWDAEEYLRLRLKKDPTNAEARAAYEAAKQKRQQAQETRSEYGCQS